MFLNWSARKEFDKQSSPPYQGGGAQSAGVVLLLTRNPGNKK